MISPDFPLPSRRILVVDDNHDSASMLALLLGSHGHSVVQAHDGAAALALAREFVPEVVFLDLLMPGMDGFDVLRQLRAQERLTTSRAIVIALSACGDAAYREATAEEGFDGHLQKPFDPQDLLEIVPDLHLCPAPPALAHRAGSIGHVG